MRSNKLAGYETNVKIVIAFLVMGVGGNKISQLPTFLDIPDNNVGKASLPVVEDDVGSVIQEMALAEIKEGLREEINATLDEKHDKWGKKKKL
eukprot:12867355-Ditylum_brightwellii.AAC.1